VITATRNKQPRRGGFYEPAGYGVAPASNPYVALYTSETSAAPVAGAHPLYDTAHNRRLLERESEITAAFDAIEPALKDVAALQWQEGFADRAQSLVTNRLGFELPASCLKADWLKPLNMQGLYAYSVYRTFQALANRAFDRSLADLAEGEPAQELIRKWGFHAIDITPCADGRLSGVVDYILRVPPAMVANRKSFAGSMFDIEESLRNWSDVELRRHREALPNPASEPTRYLKIGVYHTSSSDPAHEGCAAHGSDARKAAGALLDRLTAFRQAIENSHCCGASVATLLVGVDTDTDAIRVHVPNAQGEMSLERYVDNQELFDASAALARDAAKDFIRARVAEAAGVAQDDLASEGMRWFCGYLLKNNLAQVEYVRRYHAGRYADLGHTERCIVVGDSFDDVQLRNLAYQAQMETVEEGAADMDVGIKIFKKVNVARGLPVPVIVHFRYDGRVPGARARAVRRSERLAQAIEARYPALVSDGTLYTYTSVKDYASGSRLEEIDGSDASGGRECACGCHKAESRQ